MKITYTPILDLHNKYEILMICYDEGPKIEHTLWVDECDIQKTILELEAFSNQFYFENLNGEKYLWSQETFTERFKWVSTYPKCAYADFFCNLKSVEIFYYNEDGKKYRVALEGLENFKKQITDYHTHIDSQEEEIKPQQYVDTLCSIIEKYILEHNLDSQREYSTFSPLKI